MLVCAHVQPRARVSWRVRAHAGMYIQECLEFVPKRGCLVINTVV